MNNLKLVKSLWLSIVNFLQVYVLTDEEEKGYMSQVLYASRKFGDFNIEMVNISYAVGVFSRHMEKLGEENGNGCFKYIRTSITYNCCNDLVYGYDSWDLDKCIDLLDMLLIETEWSKLEWIMQLCSRNGIVREVAELWWCLASLAGKVRDELIKGMIY